MIDVKAIAGYASPSYERCECLKSSGLQSRCERLTPLSTWEAGVITGSSSHEASFASDVFSFSIPNSCEQAAPLQGKPGILFDGLDSQSWSDARVVLGKSLVLKWDLQLFYN